MTPDQAAAEYRRWLADHHEDPALIAGCHRLGLLLAEGGDRA